MGIKSAGGLTHGRGFSKSTRLLFLLSRPQCSETTQSIFEIAGLSTNITDGHRDLTPSRMQQNAKDIEKILEILLEREPFTMATTQLKSLSTGLYADERVNADRAREVGENILRSMEGHTVAEVLTEKQGQDLSVIHICKNLIR